MPSLRIRRVQMRERTRRTRVERLVMLRPEALRPLFDLAIRLPLLRRLILRDTIDRAYAALRREDLELPARLYYHPEAVLRFADDVGMDYEDRYQGRDLVFDVYRQWLEEWGHMQREPIGYVDRGDTLVVLGRERVRGELSGLEVERELAQVFRLRGAIVLEHTEYRSWARALEH